MKKLSIILIACLFACKKQIPAETAQFKIMQAEKISCINCVYAYGTRFGAVVHSKEFCKQYCIYLENWKP